MLDEIKAATPKQIERKKHYNKHWLVEYNKKIESYINK